MSKIIIDVPDGEYCKGCYLLEDVKIQFPLAILVGCKKFKKIVGNEGQRPKKCPACIAAIKAYKERT